MATRLSAGAAGGGGGNDLTPLNIAPGAEDRVRGQATNLSGSHRPTTNNAGILTSVEYFADEIVLGELEKREIMGIPINRRMSLAIVACCCLSVVAVAVILAKAFSHGGSHGDSEVQHNKATISQAEGDRRYKLFQSTLEPLTGASIDGSDSPEAQALYWISYDDSAQIDPQSHIDKVTQRFVLATLYFSTGGDDWEHSFSFLSHHDECEWNHGGDSLGGAYCNDNGYVDTLVLSGLKMGGTLPKDVGLLTHLSHLDMSNNNVQEHLPSSIGLLHQLTHMDFSRNQMSGFAPNNAQKLTKLETLNLNDNDFDGEIPYAYLSDLPKIVKINLSNNRFTGFVHDDWNELWGMTSLQRLELQFNKLEGKIPTFLRQIESIKLLDLSNNDFTGTIPQQYATMESLTQFDLSHNRLTGSIPASFGDDSFGISGDMTLTVFRAASNNLVGHFPVGLTRMPQLGIIDLNDNGLDGSIPTEIGDMKQLQILDISKNSFGNTIPTELGACRSLVELNLSDNKLVERVPTQLGALGSLEKLNIRNNLLEGSVPTEFRNIPELKSALLSGNNFIDNLDPILCDRPVAFPKLVTLEADCVGNLLTCSCCTTCCNFDRECCTPGTPSCKNL